MNKIFVLFFLVLISVNAQSKDPNKLLKALEAKFEKVKDYQAEVDVRLDMEFIKVPPTKGKVYFKQPDKFKFESDGFAMLPKQSTNFSPMQLLKGDYTSVFVRTEKIDGNSLDVVKLVPNNDTSNFIISTLWIDAANSVISKVETTTKKSGTVKTEFTYTHATIPLPTVLKLSFNLGEANLPENPMNSKKETDQNRRPTRIKGLVIMTYSNYKINKGIPDKLFEEKKK
jgi:outer membrane lipoprotein-sorting protein